MLDCLYFIKRLLMNIRYILIAIGNLNGRCLRSGENSALAGLPDRADAQNV
jgi:hypothetical protein